MKSIQLNIKKIDNTLYEIQNILGGKLLKKGNELTLILNSSIASGTIKFVQLKGGITFLHCDITLHKNLELAYQMSLKRYVSFIYCSKGQLQHRFNQSYTPKVLETFKTGIIANISQPNNYLSFNKNKPIVTSIICVNTLFSKTKINRVNTQLHQQYINNSNVDMAYISRPNLKIAQQVTQLQNSKQNGIVKMLVIEGLVHLILALEIAQYSTDRANQKEHMGNLTKAEMEAVKELSDFIKNYPETPMTVTDMAKKISITPSKLQDGFKLIHNTTVNDYIRSTRVKKSEELIKTTDMNITQILYTVGFSSRSYFSKIFKQKYNCSPSHYKSEYQNVLQA